MTRAWNSINTDLNIDATKQGLTALEKAAEDSDVSQKFSKAKSDLEFAVTEAQSVGHVGEALSNCLNRIDEARKEAGEIPEPKSTYKAVHKAITKTSNDCSDAVRH